MEIPIELNNGVPGGCSYRMQQLDVFEYLKILRVKEGRFSLQNSNLPLNFNLIGIQFAQYRMFKKSG